MMAKARSFLTFAARFASVCLVLFLFGAALSGQESRFKDTLGRAVAIPARAHRILSLQPEITRIIVALGAGERLVGIDYFIRREDHLFKIVFPEGASLPAVSKPDESVNKELVVRLSPDIVFTSPTEQQLPESIQQSLGIPVAALASMGRFEKLLEEIELVGVLTGTEKRARELTAYFQEKTKFISETIGPAPANNRLRAYLSFWSNLVRTPVFYEPVYAAGGRNVADNLLPSYLGTIGTVVTLEQVIKWNPDIILIQGSYLPRGRHVTVEGVLEDNRLGSIKAVRKKRVHYTLGFWYWWDPAGVLVETLYLARLFHPEKFSGLNIEEEGNAIFEMFYRKKDVFSALARVLNFDEWTKK
jgi:iron complex transport system substrate-binding protein